jgi:hypothetical protein
MQQAVMLAREATAQAQAAAAKAAPKESPAATEQQQLQKPDVLQWAKQRAANIEEMKKKQRENPKHWRSREDLVETDSSSEEGGGDQAAAKKEKKQAAAKSVDEKPPKQTKEEKETVKACNKMLVQAAFKTATGFTMNKYKSELESRMQKVRASDKDKTISPTTLALCGQVREWGFTDTTNDSPGSEEKWLICVGVACPKTSTLPERVCVHWLKQYAPGSQGYVIDIGYHGMMVEASLVQAEKIVEHKLHQDKLWLIPDWESADPAPQPEPMEVPVVPAEEPAEEQELAAMDESDE